MTTREDCWFVMWLLLLIVLSIGALLAGIYWADASSPPSYWMLA